MRIDIPQSSHPFTRIIAQLPNGEKIVSTFMSGIKSADIELPEGVNENAVGVDAEFLSNAREVQDSTTVKYSIDIPSPPDLGEGPVNLTGPEGEKGPCGLASCDGECQHTVEGPATDAELEDPTRLDCGCDPEEEVCDKCEPPKTDANAQ